MKPDLPGDVLLIRNKGPKGGPGMPETLAVTLATTRSELKRVALATGGCRPEIASSSEANEEGNSEPPKHRKPLV